MPRINGHGMRHAGRGTRSERSYEGYPGPGAWQARCGDGIAVASGQHIQLKSLALYNSTGEEPECDGARATVGGNCG